MRILTNQLASKLFRIKLAIYNQVLTWVVRDESSKNLSHQVSYGILTIAKYFTTSPCSDRTKTMALPRDGEALHHPSD